MSTETTKSEIPAINIAVESKITGKIARELIATCLPRVPAKGTNAGKQMYIVNGKHWSNVEPQVTDTHVCLQDVVVSGVTYTNVVGFANDARMGIQDKIKLVTGNDAGYAMAIASLLK